MNRSPSLVPVAACVAGAVTVPIHTALPSKSTARHQHRAPGWVSQPPWPDSADDRGILAEQGHRQRRATSRSVPDCLVQPQHRIVHWAPSDATTRPPRPGDRGRITASPTPPMPRPDRELIHEYASSPPDDLFGTTGLGLVLGHGSAGRCDALMWRGWKRWGEVAVPVGTVGERLGVSVALGRSCGVWWE